MLRGASIAGFGFLALWLGWVVFPLHRAFGRARSGHEASVRAQLAVHRAMRVFVRVSCDWLGLVRVRVVNGERLQARPKLVVANHPSLFDTPLLLHVMPQADFIVSEEWSANPILRATVKGADYLRADRGPHVIRDAVERLRAGRSVVVYPEGSRTPPEGLRAFGRGAAHIALHAGCEIVPVVIRVEPRFLMKGQSFGELSSTRPVFTIEVGDPIRPEEHIREDEGRSDSARRLTAMLQDHFEKRWNRVSC